MQATLAKADRRCLLRLGGVLLLALGGAAQAEALSPELEISAHANLLVAADAAHPLPSRPAQGNATQDAVVSAIVAGRRSAAGITRSLAVDGSLPQGGLLRDVGDGVGIAARIDGSCDGAPAQSDGLYGEYDFVLRNRSSSVRYKLTLKIDYANAVAAQGPAAEGAGAYGIGLITLGRDSGELFSSNLTSDTTLGDRIDVTPTGASGQPLNEAGARTLELELAPGAVLRLQGRQELRGAASTPGAAYRGALSAFFSIAAAAQTGARPPPPANPADVMQVPEKNGGIANLSAAAVCGLVVLAIAWAVLRRRK
jgi:hypothetical protein